MKEAKMLEIKREDYSDKTLFVAYVLVNRGNNSTDNYEVIRVPVVNHAKADCNHLLSPITSDYVNDR